MKTILYYGRIKMVVILFIYIEVSVIPSYHETVSMYKCNLDSIFYQGTYFLKDTSFLNYYTSQYGCDSIVRINIINYPNSIAMHTIHNICNGDSIQIDNIWYHDSITIITQFNNQYGCDSFHMTQVKLFPIPEPTAITFYFCIGRLGPDWANMVYYCQWIHCS